MHQQRYKNIFISHTNLLANTFQGHGLHRDFVWGIGLFCAHLQCVCVCGLCVCCKIIYMHMCMHVHTEGCSSSSLSDLLLKQGLSLHLEHCLPFQLSWLWSFRDSSSPEVRAIYMGAGGSELMSSSAFTTRAISPAPHLNF